jgi:TonB family protein
VTPPDASLSAPALLPAVTPDPLAPVGATDGDGDASADADGGEGEGEPRAGGGATAGGGQGIRVVHWSEVTPRRRVKPQFPEAALQMGLHEGVCVVRIHIDPRGVPTEVVRQGCPKVFEAATVDAAMAWRFTPLLEDGQGVPAQFDLRVNYVAD